jgi:hypothetical protein
LFGVPIPEEATKMRRAKLLVVVSLAVASGTAMAQERARTVPGVPPRFVIVSDINQQQGELVLTGVTMLFVAEQRLKQVERDGKVEEIVETIRKPVFESRSETVALDSTDVYEADGKKLSLESVWKRAVVGTAAVVSADGKKVDPVYLKALAKDTLVFVTPQVTKQGAADDGEGN